MNTGTYKEEREHVGQVNDPLLITTWPKSINVKVFLGLFPLHKFQVFESLRQNIILYYSFLNTQCNFPFGVNTSKELCKHWVYDCRDLEKGN